jgi:DNA helicase-2/ATP-dependent DNA helicase PcrA
VSHDDASVFAVVDWIDLSMNLGESPVATDTDWTENNAVNIMTIHSAKGLEFPVVFLVNLVSQRFPTMERREQIPIPDGLIKEILPGGDFHEQEERRLFYVGMTRSRDELYFTAAQYYGEGKREKKLSAFIIDAIGEQSVMPQVAVVEQTKQLSFLDWKKEDPKEEKKSQQTISYLSYSQLSTFETCPLQYKYRYILKIPVPPSAALTFGDTIHRTVRAFYELVRSGKHPTGETLLRLLDDHWVSVGYGDKKYEEKMKRHGIELLTGFYKKGYDPKIVPTSLEEPFKIKITPTLTLGGKIDRIDSLPGGAIEIIDYKTGQAPKNRDVTKDPQLTVYALSATSGTSIYQKKPEKVIVSFYFFEGQEKISSTRTADQLSAAKEDIAQKAKIMEQSDFTPTPGKHCDFCEFRLICEAWN